MESVKLKVVGQVIFLLKLYHIIPSKLSLGLNSKKGLFSKQQLTSNFSNCQLFKCLDVWSDFLFFYKDCHSSHLSLKCL